MRLVQIRGINMEIVKGHITNTQPLTYIIYVYIHFWLFKQKYIFCSAGIFCIK